MSTFLAGLLAIASAMPCADDSVLFGPQESPFLTAIRGQSSADVIVAAQEFQELSPGGIAPETPPPTFAPDGSYPVPASPYQSSPPAYDPFLNPPGGVSPLPCPPAAPPMPAFGPNGFQPYRIGWTHRYDLGVLPKASSSDGLGDFGVFEFDSEWEHTLLFPDSNWIYSFTQEFDLRSWNGPDSSLIVPTVALPGSVFRVGWDFEIATPANTPWSFQLAFNPSINSDFEQSLSSEAWNLDARGVLFFNYSPQWTWALGVGYWDRVNDYIIPYAGVIWKPDDVWEWRLVFPQPRVSVLLGSSWGFTDRLYVQAEFHVEAYEIDLETTVAREQVEVRDWRVVVGIQGDHARFSKFTEVGWVFDRNVDFLNGTPGFDVSPGFIALAGLSY